jgi:coproporphyrinogen III oxidase-like Fe-S oxidoreductase
MRALRKDTVTAMSFKTRNAMSLSKLFNGKQGHFELEIDITPDTARISGFDLIAEEGDCFLVTDLGRAFVRNLANHFDFYDANKSNKVKFSQSI